MTNAVHHNIPADITITTQLDTRGLRCPEPIMMLHQAIRKIQSGEVIAITATDPSTSWDIPKFCTHLGHELIYTNKQELETNTEYFYLIQRK